MCGINGSLIYKEKSLLENINSMNKLIIHRGPDDDGVFHETNKSYSVALGMRRLSIIDLSNGNQPMNSDDEKVIIVFNGEIYNYKVLKSKLEAKSPKSPRDLAQISEVLIVNFHHSKMEVSKETTKMIA